MHSALVRLLAATCFFAGVLCFCGPSEPVAAQQPSLRITSPVDGAVVAAGETLHVTVQAVPEESFQMMAIFAESPISTSQVLTGPPYRFSVAIPQNIRPRKYIMTAEGVISPGKGANSDPLTIDVERTDEPVGLKCEPSVLDFRSVGDSTSISPIGIFKDQPRVDLSESSYTKYSSDNPGVATVQKDGIVKATGVGSTKISITYHGLSTAVSVRVRDGSK